MSDDEARPRLEEPTGFPRFDSGSDLDGDEMIQVSVHKFHACNALPADDGHGKEHERQAAQKLGADGKTREEPLHGLPSFVINTSRHRAVRLRRQVVSVPLHNIEEQEGCRRSSR